MLNCEIRRWITCFQSLTGRKDQKTNFRAFIDLLQCMWISKFQSIRCDHIVPGIKNWLMYPSRSSSFSPLHCFQHSRCFFFLDLFVKSHSISLLDILQSVNLMICQHELYFGEEARVNTSQFRQFLPNVLPRSLRKLQQNSLLQV